MLSWARGMISGRARIFLPLFQSPPGRGSPNPVPTYQAELADLPPLSARSVT
jgi:hypothetical protein